MSERSNPPSVTAASDVPEFNQPQSWEAGHGVVPAPSTPAAELRTASAYASYQTYDAEQRSDSLPAYAAVSRMEDWKPQYDGAGWQSGNADVQGFTAMPPPTENYYRNENDPPAGFDMNAAGRGTSSSALRQPASTPASSKKTVTFHENIATEYAIHRSYGSTSSDSSFVPLSPPETSGGYDSGVFPAPINSYGSPVPR